MHTYFQLFLKQDSMLRFLVLLSAESIGGDIFGELSLFLLLIYFLWLHLQHMEGPRLGVKSELQLPAYATVTATLDPN